MEIKEFYHKATSTFSYVVFSKASKESVVIDPVLDYSAEENKTSTESADQIISYLNLNQLNLKYILETHVHADHLTASELINKKFPTAQVAINSKVTEVQKIFKAKGLLPTDFKTDGTQFNILLTDQQLIELSDFNIKVLFTPGHTPACTSFLIGEHLFTGDAIFMPDLGCGRCDFPGGSAEQLYASITDKIYSLPDNYKMYLGHDYPPQNRGLQFCTTIAEQKNSNKAISRLTKKQDFIHFRTNRDKELNEPKLIQQSLKVNLNAGLTQLL